MQDVEILSDLSLGLTAIKMSQEYGTLPIIVRSRDLQETRPCFASLQHGTPFRVTVTCRSYRDGPVLKRQCGQDGTYSFKKVRQASISSLCDQNSQRLFHNVFAVLMSVSTVNIYSEEASVTETK